MKHTVNKLLFTEGALSLLLIYPCIVGFFVYSAMQPF